MEERDDPVSARLDEAAARLKAASPPAPAGELEALEGLAHARITVRRARERIAELEAELRGMLDDRGIV